MQNVFEKYIQLTFNENRHFEARARCFVGGVWNQNLGSSLLPRLCTCVPCFFRLQTSPCNLSPEVSYTVKGFRRHPKLDPCEMHYEACVAPHRKGPDFHENLSGSQRGLGLQGSKTKISGLLGSTSSALGLRAPLWSTILISKILFLTLNQIRNKKSHQFRSS